MRIGIIGIGQSGKTSLFSLLTNIDYKLALESQLSGNPRSVSVNIPEDRLRLLAGEFGLDKKIVMPQIDFVDTVPITLSAQTKTKNPEILALLRETDGILVVIKAYGPSNTTKDELVKQINTIKSELMLADLFIIEKRIDKLKNQKKGRSSVNQNQDKKETELLSRIQKKISESTNLNLLEINGDLGDFISGFRLLSVKPVINFLNISELDISSDKHKEMLSLYPDILISPLKLELDLLGVSDREKKQFMKDYGLSELILPKVIKTCYKNAGFISFFTVGKKEIKAWTIKSGDNAVIAAGKIHTDMARGFISAEVVGFDDWKRSGSYKNARQQGKVRLEGKDYIVKDGDIINFKFNV